MRKIRRFLQVLLFINFMVGVGQGMKAGNLVSILINGIIVLAIIANQDSEEDREDESKN